MQLVCIHYYFITRSHVKIGYWLEQITGEALLFLLLLFLFSSLFSSLYSVDCD